MKEYEYNEIVRRIKNKSTTVKKQGFDYWAIAHRLKEERIKYADISMEQLSDLLERFFEVKAPRHKISMWESGKKAPTLKEFEALADIYNCDLYYLMGISIYRH